MAATSTLPAPKTAAPPSTLRTPAHEFAVAWMVRALKDLHRDVMESRERWEALEREGQHEEAREVRAAAQAHGAALRALLESARTMHASAQPITETRINKRSTT